MVKNKKKDKIETQKEKGKTDRKSRSGLPQVNVVDAIEFVKKAYASIGTSLKSFSGMAEAMEVSEAYGRIAFGDLNTLYCLIEQEDSGWKISDLGRRAAIGDKTAVMEILEKNKILKTLYSELKGKKFDRDFLEDYIKKKRFAYNINTNLVADRFLAAVDYLNKLQDTSKPNEIVSTEQNPLLIDIIKLHYALSPPQKQEIQSLVEDISKKANQSEDETIKTIVDGMMRNKSNELFLKEFLASLIEILSKKYPNLKIESKNKEITPK